MDRFAARARGTTLHILVVLLVLSLALLSWPGVSRATDTDLADVSVTVTGVRMFAYEASDSLNGPVLFTEVAGQWVPAGELGQEAEAESGYDWPTTGPGTWRGVFLDVPPGTYRFGTLGNPSGGAPFVDAPPIIVGADDLSWEYRIPDIAGIRGQAVTEDGPLDADVAYETQCLLSGAGGSRNLLIFPQTVPYLADYWGSPHRTTPAGYFEEELAPDDVGGVLRIECHYSSPAGIDYAGSVEVDYVGCLVEVAVVLAATPGGPLQPQASPDARRSESPGCDAGPSPSPDPTTDPGTPPFVPPPEPSEDPGPVASQPPSVSPTVAPTPRSKATAAVPTQASGPGGGSPGRSEPSVAEAVLPPPAATTPEPAEEQMAVGAGGQSEALASQEAAAAGDLGERQGSGVMSSPALIGWLLLGAGVLLAAILVPRLGRR